MKYVPENLRTPEMIKIVKKKLEKENRYSIDEHKDEVKKELLERGYDFFFGDDAMDVPAGVCKPSDIVYSWDECSQSYVPKKKRKSRRKQLVTKGDIKGLAALKGVVGTGKIMETWIATHV